MQSLVVLALVAVTAASEFVWIQDLNLDHNRRNLEAGLPSSLKFDLKRKGLADGTMKLNLQENKRLNPNAPVFEAHVDKDGKQRLNRKNPHPMKGLKFYQDKTNGGTFQISCETTANGPCRRLLTGSFYINRKAYDISPMPSLFTARGLDNSRSAGTPHLLVERSNAPVLSEKNEAADFLEIPGNKEVMRNELLREIEALLDQKQVDKIAERRSKRANNVYALEIVVGCDPAMWKIFYDQTTASGGLTRNDATELKLRQHFVHILNGMSLRYEEIEDAEMDIYLTLSGFIFYKMIDSTNPLPTTTSIPVIDGVGYVDAETYLVNVKTWAGSLTGLPHNDHILMFTGYELFSGSTSNSAVAGMAYVKAVCGSSRVSINEGNGDYFTTTSVASHELGHNLGSSHDGTGTSADCDPIAENIMAPQVASLHNNDYSVNPWRFSTCSVNAFKTYVNGLGSANCLLDYGDYYDKAEYDTHVALLPGQLHDADAQCKLVRGDNSKACGSANSEAICMTMSCLADDGYCWYYAAARGTSCGAAADNKWCIEGQCVARTSAGSGGSNSATSGGNSESTGGSQVTTQAPATTRTATQATSSGCEDLGWEGWSCQEISDYLLDNLGATPSDWCQDPKWNNNCCVFCAGETEEPTTTTTTPAPTPAPADTGCVDLGWNRWSCQKISEYFLATYNATPQDWCRDPEWKGNCCALCAGEVSEGIKQCLHKQPPYFNRTNLKYHNCIQKTYQREGRHADIVSARKPLLETMVFSGLKLDM